MKTVIIVDSVEYTPEDFAALWGCEPKYDHSPRIPGDGFMFYNFGSDKVIKDRHFLENFIGAIDRTITGQRLTNTPFDDNDAIIGLEELKAYVIKLINQLPV